MQLKAFFFPTCWIHVEYSAVIAHAILIKRPQLTLLGARVHVVRKRSLLGYTAANLKGLGSADDLKVGERQRKQRIRHSYSRTGLKEAHTELL